MIKVNHGIFKNMNPDTLGLMLMTEEEIDATWRRQQKYNRENGLRHYTHAIDFKGRVTLA